MKEDPSQEQSLQTWIDLFSDPATSLSTLLENGFGSESAFSPSPYLALWFEYFLVAESKPVKEKWASLSFEKQIGLGIELLKYYLFQPLYIRLSNEAKTSVMKAPLKLESRGKLFRVEHGTGTNRKIELLYPLNHSRIWPNLFRFFQEDFFSSEKVFKALEPGILLAFSSHLEKIRHRAETLSSLFLKEKYQEISTGLSPGEQSEIKNAQEEPSGQAEGDIHPPEKMWLDLPADQPPPPISDLLPSPPSPPKRKKKKKPSDDQLELF
jgi:hypothetical protein